MRRRLYSRFRFLVFLLAFFGSLFLGGTIFLSSLTAPVTREDSPPQKFVIARGDSVPVLASRLYEAGLIRSPLGFRWVVKREGLGSALQAGTYFLSPSSSASAIALSLTRGVSDLRLTVPEGFRLEQIAALLASKLDFSANDFLEQARVSEGYLFPDTYFFTPHSSAARVFDTMRDNFVKKVGEIDSETLILASLIERETKTPAEKPLVAGILRRRLDAGWPLELDATIQYALGTPSAWWPSPTLADRQLASPFNTYLHSGLPPHPICNPGLNSINAARHPQESAYWFYLHDRNGQIHYATTLEEHQANIARYLR